MTTVSEVREHFERQRQKIADLDQSLANERSELKRKAFEEGRALTDDELKRRREIVVERERWAKAMEGLALETVAALENASDVDTLLKKINALNQQLRGDLERLQEVEAHAARAEAVAKGLASLVGALLDLKQTWA